MPHKTEALAEALEILEAATSFTTKKARDGHAKAVAGLRAAINSQPPAPREPIAVARIAAIENGQIGLVWWIALSDLEKAGVVVDATLYTLPPASLTATAGIAERGRATKKHDGPCWRNSHADCGC